MTKSKNTKTTKPVPRPKKLARKRMVRADQSDSLDHAAVLHAHMLADPCGAELAQTTYTGDPGYVNRFNKARTLGTGAGNTTTPLPRCLLIC